MFRKSYAALFTLAFAAMAPASAQEKLLIGSTSASSSHYGYFVAVSQLINDKVEGVASSVVETGATVDNLRRLSRNQVDLGLVTTNTGFQAYKGTADFEGKPVDTRLLWVYVAAPQNMIVRADSGVTKLADLNGKALNPGLRGSSTEKTTEAVFKIRHGASVLLPMRALISTTKRRTRSPRRSWKMKAFRPMRWRL